MRAERGETVAERAHHVLAARVEVAEVDDRVADAESLSAPWIELVPS
jgi:hypothetical protein